MPSSDESDEPWDEIGSDDDDDDSSDGSSSPSIHTSDEESQLSVDPRERVPRKRARTHPENTDSDDEFTPEQPVVKAGNKRPRPRKDESDEDADFVPVSPVTKVQETEEADETIVWRHLVTVVNLLEVQKSTATAAYDDYMKQPLNKQWLPKVNVVLQDVETAGEEFMKKFEGSTAAVMAAQLQHLKVSNIQVETVKEQTSETCILTRKPVPKARLRRCKCWSSVDEGAEPVVTFYVHQNLVPLVFTLHTIFNLNDRIAAFSRIYCTMKKGKDVRVIVANMDVSKLVRGVGTRVVATAPENEVSGRTRDLTCFALSNLRHLTQRGPTMPVASSLKVALIV